MPARCAATHWRIGAVTSTKSWPCGGHGEVMQTLAHALQLWRILRPCKTGRMPPRFHTLRIASLRRETEDAVSLTFAVPDALREAIASRRAST